MSCGFCGRFFLFSLWVRVLKDWLKAGHFQLLFSYGQRPKIWLRAIQKPDLDLFCVHHQMTSHVEKQGQQTNLQIRFCLLFYINVTRCNLFNKVVWNKLILYSWCIIGRPHRLMIKSFLRLKNGLKFMSRKTSLRVVQHVLGPYYCLSVLQEMSPH